MAELEALEKSIVEGIQELKGKKITIVDMTSLEERVCDYFIICEGNSTTHVLSIADSIQEYVRINTSEKPFAVVGKDNAEWVAFDYGQTMVHVFLPKTRTFYDLEHLWSDANLIEIPDLD